MKEGDIVRWNGVSRVESGVLVREKCAGDWYVSLSNGKYVLVNEKSFIKDE